MRLSSHAVQNFRNLKESVFLPESGVNVVFGDNGQGKTNLLESIYLLTGAKSFRARRDAEMIRRGESFGTVLSHFFADGREQQIRLLLSEGGREAEWNRGARKKASELAGVFCCVLFSPEHLMLLKGSPEQRRRFIDLALCQISPRYLAELKRYHRVLSQKNGLLKHVYRIPDAFDLLDVYDAQLTEAAFSVTSARMKFCEGLLPAAAEGYAVIAGGREKLDFRYLSTVWQAEPDMESGLERMRSSRESDLRTGFCGMGPHRDDLLVTIGGSDARAFGSQGQQRSAVLALKLAEAGMIERAAGEKPVLLLDDVLSELDGRRQDYLIRRILPYQTVITGCDPSLVEKRTDAALFRMEDGALTGRGRLPAAEG